MQTTFQKINPTQASTLSALAKKTFYDTFTGTCTEGDMDSFLEEFYNETTLGKEINDTNNQYYFALQHDEIVGYILFADNNIGFDEIKGSTALELKRFYVLSQYHGKGIAQNMMQFLLDNATTQGYDVVFLGVWEHNLRAQTFYKKYGFITTSHTHDFPIGNTPQTDVYMVKFLEK